jgi:hypothetical protein
MLCLPSGLFPSGPPCQNPVFTPLGSNACYMVGPSKLHCLEVLNDIWRGVQVISSSVCSVLQPLTLSSLLNPNIIFSTVFSVYALTLIGQTKFQTHIKLQENLLFYIPLC